MDPLDLYESSLWLSRQHSMSEPRCHRVLTSHRGLYLMYCGPLSHSNAILTAEDKKSLVQAIFATSLAS